MSSAQVIEGFRLSSQQRQLWLEHGGGAAVVQGVARVGGALDAGRLERAIAATVARHEALRTGFERLPGMELPIQVVRERAGAAWRRLEAPAAGAEAAREALERAAAADRRPYALDGEDALRCALVEGAAGEHLLVLTLPAMCADLRSLDNLLAEVARAYAAADPDHAAGDADDDEPLQYVQFSEWQNEVLEEEEAPEERELWRSQEERWPEVPELPLAAAGHPDAVVAGGVARLELDAERTAAAEALAESCGASLRELALGCWVALLLRLCGRGELGVGVYSDGRRYDELEAALGPFGRYLPLGLRALPERPFGRELARTAKLLEAAAAAEVYFDAPRSFGPLVGFDFERRARPIAAGGLSWSMLSKRLGGPEPFALRLAAVREEGTLHLELHDPGARWAAGELERLAARLAALWRSVLERPRAAVAELEVLSREERRQLAAWNDTRLEVAEPRCLPQRLALAAARSPDAVAVVDGAWQLSFGELERRAGRLAGALAARGVGPESRVGLYLERSVEQVVALAAIWKAGAAYLPLDRWQPRERLAWMLDDAGAAWVVSQRSMAGDLEAAEGRTLLVDGEPPPAPSERRRTAALHPEGLAYVIYTSGSTGRPKGTLVEHRSAVSLAAALGRAIDDDLSPQVPLRVAVNAPLAFDASVKQVVQLLAGHTLVTVPEEVRTDGEALFRCLERDRVDVLDCTPSQLRLLLAAGLCAAAAPASPRRLLIGGEAIDAETWELLGAGRRRAYNLYGPTECTVDASLCRIAPGEAPHVGRPLPNVQLYVLDGRGRRLPLGVAGEVWIGGAGVSRGYLRQPALTAERFCPDPFGAEPGARLYRTGDRGRWRPDGRLELLGRLDHQVKLRGVRLELGEVAAVLAEHPEVAEAVAVLREDRPGDQRLVVYVVPRKGSGAALSSAATSGAGGLRALMRRHLGEHLLPSAVVTLDALPLNRNGKVDRAALPPPEAAEPEEAEGRSALTPFEEMLAGIWSEVLGVADVAPEASFFELGGHSLNATQLMSRLRKAFDVELPLRALFETPTLAGLARQVERVYRRSGERERPPLVPVSRQVDLPLSFAQQRLWFFDQLEPGNPAYNAPVALRLVGPLDVAALELSFSEIVRRHEVLRTRFPTVGGEPVQEVLEPAAVPLPVVDLGGLPDEARGPLARRLARAEAERSFDLARGPLFRVRLLRLGTEEHAMVATLHHVVTDGWSMAILTREVAVLYGAFSQRRPSPLPELPIQYADFAHWQRRWLSGEVLQEQLSYWRKHLAGELPLLELPIDRPRPAHPSYRGDRCVLDLGAELSRELAALSRRRGVTLFMTLLAAFEIQLGRYSGQDDLIVGMTMASRNQRETEDLIGFFINTLPLRVDLSRAATFPELLGQVREVVLDAFAHQDVPLEKLVEEIRPERHEDSSPLFQVTFGVQNAPRDTLEAGELKTLPLGAGRETARFDLTLWVLETPEGLRAVWTYSTDLFERRTIERMHRHLETLLGSIVEQPEAAIDSLAMLSEAEEQERLSRQQARSERKRSLLKAVRPKSVKVAT